MASRCLRILRCGVAASKKSMVLETSISLAYSNLGVLLLKKGLYGEATKNYLKLLKISPGSIDAMLNLGNSLMEANQNKKALKIFEKLIELKPEWSIARLCASKTLQKLNRYEDAVDVLVIDLKK